MSKIILLLLIVVPALEIGLLVLSGNIIGIWPTVLLIVMTGVLGAWLARKEGLQTIRSAQLRLQNGEIPGGLILDGVCILVGGVVLLTPGFITDTIGFLLLLPFTRSFFKGILQKIFTYLLQNGKLIIIKRS